MQSYAVMRYYKDDYEFYVFYALPFTGKLYISIMKC